jgi:hypothetical protein
LESDFVSEICPRSTTPFDSNLKSPDSVLFSKHTSLSGSFAVCLKVALPGIELIGLADWAVFVAFVEEL